MNVLQRPLFRQAGGPIAPPQGGMPPQGMPPQGMPPAGMEQQLQATEQAAAQNMQQVGQEYMAQTMGALDAAETPKDVIDAIRGNALPIEARYQELASLVGEQDAMRTPETVLALVQPTIMMTEQGAMDSGIGELMQSITGQIDMETESGQPTPMAGGVGSLMMAGAQPEEVGQQPVANFSQGGYVRRFANGGAADSRLGQLYSEMLPTYESILGGDDNDAKAQALFAIAQAAGQFAAGRGPQGEDLRGTSMAGQLGAALGGLSGTLGAQASERRKTQSATRLAALQAAQTESAAEKAYARDLALARAKKGDELDVLTLYSPDGVAKTFETSTAAGKEAARSALQEGFTDVKPGTAEFKGTTFYRTNAETGEVERVEVNTGTPAGIARAEELTANGYTTDDAEANRILEERFNVRAEQRAEGRTLGAEQRAEQRAIAAEQRAQDRTLSAEERAVATRIAQEARAEQRSIAAEQRAENRTLSAETRELSRQIAQEGRAEQRAIAAEQRAQDMTLSAEDRAEARRIAAEARAEQRAIGAEVRASEENERRFLRDESARLERMLIENQYAIEAEDRTLVRQLAQYNRERADKLSDDEVAMRLEQMRSDRDFSIRQIEEQRQRGYEYVNLVLDDGTTRSFVATDPRIEELINSGQATVTGMAEQPEEKPDQPFGAGLTGRQLAIITDEDAVQRFETGQMPPEEETRFVGALENYLAPTVNQQGNTVVNPLPTRMGQALRNRASAGLPVPESITPELYQPRGAAAPGAPAGYGEARAPETRIFPPGFDVTKATGAVGGVMRGAEALASQASEFGVGSGSLGPGFREALEAKSKLNALAQETDRYFTSSVTGRPLAIEYQNLQQEIVRPDAAKSDAEALSSLSSMRTLLIRARDQAQTVLNNPRRYSPTTVEGARQDLEKLRILLPEYDYAIGQYQGKTSEGKPDPAQFRR